MKRLLLSLVFVFLSWGVLAAPQQIYVGPADIPVPTWATPADFGDGVPFCRGHYTSNRYEANGAGWFTDYPGADINFLVRLGELTTIRPGKPVVVPLDSPLLFNCPLLYMSDVGTLKLKDTEIRNLRAYLRKGGFLWVDDFWGTRAWVQWIEEIRQVLPDSPLLAIGNDHPVFHQQYDLPGIWQMPTTGLWYMRDDGTMQTSERGDDSLTPHVRGLTDNRGRLVVLMTHNSDIADGWEAAEQAENRDYFRAFSARAYGLGVNVVLYLLTH